MEEFQHHASIDWPKTDINNPSSWFTEIYHLEDWLNNYIGNHMQDWKYINDSNHLIIGFNKPEHKTFFLIGYTK